MKEIATQKGVKNLYRLMLDSGLTVHYARELAHGRLKRLDMDVLLKLCMALKCPVSELIGFVPTWDGELEKHPFLKEMVHKEEVVDMAKRLEELDHEGLKKLEEFMKGLNPS